MSKEKQSKKKYDTPPGLKGEPLKIKWDSDWVPKFLGVLSEKDKEVKNKYTPLGHRGIVVRMYTAEEMDEMENTKSLIKRATFVGDLNESGRPTSRVDSFKMKWSMVGVVISMSEAVRDKKEERGYKDLHVGSKVLLFPGQINSQSYLYLKHTHPMDFEGYMTIPLDSIQCIMQDPNEYKWTLITGIDPAKEDTNTGEKGEDENE